MHHTHVNGPIQAQSERNSIRQVDLTMFFDSRNRSKNRPKFDEKSSKTPKKGADFLQPVRRTPNFRGSDNKMFFFIIFQTTQK